MNLSHVVSWFTVRDSHKEKKIMARCTMRGMKLHYWKIELNPFSSLEGDSETRFNNKITYICGWTNACTFRQTELTSDSNIQRVSKTLTKARVLLLRSSLFFWPILTCNTAMERYWHIDYARFIYFGQKMTKLR